MIISVNTCSHAEPLIMWSTFDLFLMNLADLFHVFFPHQDIVPVDGSYEIKELYVSENKLDLAKADVETLPAVQIGKVTTDISPLSPKYWSIFPDQMFWGLTLSVMIGSAHASLTNTRDRDKGRSRESGTSRISYGLFLATGRFPKEFTLVMVIHPTKDIWLVFPFQSPPLPQCLVTWRRLLTTANRSH